MQDFEIEIRRDKKKTDRERFLLRELTRLRRFYVKHVLKLEKELASEKIFGTRRAYELSMLRAKRAKKQNRLTQRKSA